MRRARGAASGASAVIAVTLRVKPVGTAGCRPVTQPGIGDAAPAALVCVRSAGEPAGRRRRRARTASAWRTSSSTAATAYLALEGFARARVARVRVVYKDGRGGKRAGSAEPFGFVVAFLPPSIKRYYPRPGARADGPPAIEVIAYDDEGRKIGRFKHRN